MVLTGLVLLAAAAGPVLAQAGRPTGPTQGQVVGPAYLNRAAGYTHELPPSWLSHGYKWYEYWGPRAARQRPGAAFVADWVYVPVDRHKPEATLLTIAVYPAGVWRSLAAQGGPPVGEVLPDRPLGVRLERAPGRALRRRLGRRPAGDGPVRRRAAPRPARSWLLDAAGRPLAELPTQVVPFDPAVLPPTASQTALGAVCGPSAAVPRAGAYACQVEGTSDRLDPCFALSDTALACAVNPATGVHTLVTATDPLPGTTDAQAAPVPFYVELGGAKPPCAKRGQPVAIGGYAATYACQAPGAWLVGPLATARPVWIAQYATSDTQHTAITYGPEPTRVARAWVY